MLELRTLGGLDLRSDRPLGKAARQPRRLAVLAILAEGYDRGSTRDSIIGLLWSESDTESARNNLAQALFALRRDLGAEGVVSGSARLVLDRSVIDCDLWRFRQAIDAEEWEAAVALYRGPFLAGFFAGQASEFDGWVERVRNRLAGDYARAVERAASDYASRDNHAEGAVLWRRLVAYEPYNARALMAAAQQMRHAGDRAGALILIHEFGARVRKDLALPLDPALVELADSIREELAASPVDSGAPPLAIVTGATTSQGAADLTPQDPPPRRRRRRLLALAAGATTLVTTALALSRTARRVQADLPGLTIAVVPFAVEGDSADRFLGDGLARLVAQGIDGVGEIRASVLSDIGKALVTTRSAADTAGVLLERYRLQQYMSGSVAALGGALQVRIAVHDPARRGTPIGSVTVAAPRDSTLRLADDLSRRLLGIVVSSGPSELRRRASETTGSLSALKAFIEGESHFRASRFADAQASFEAAVRQDSTFALAYYRLVDALDWNGRSDLIAAAAAHALALGDRLPWRERRLLEGSMAWRQGRIDEAETILRQVTSRYPNDVDGWTQLSEVLFHSNAIRGRELREAEPALRRITELDPENRSALTHLGRVTAYRGDTVDTDAIFRNAAALFPNGVEAEVAAFHAAIAGPDEARRTTIDRLLVEGGYSIINAAHRLAAYARDLETADSLLSRAIRSGLLSGDSGETRYWMAIVAAAQGQMSRAVRELVALRSTTPGKAAELGGILLALPHRWYSDADWNELFGVLRDDNSQETRFVTSLAHVGALPRWYLLGLAAGHAGKLDILTSYEDSLQHWDVSRGGAMTARTFAGALRALRSFAAGRPDEALAMLEEGRLPMESVDQFVSGMQHERFLRALLLDRAGRREEALAVYGSLVFGHPNSILTAIPAALERARLLVRLGRREAARADYRLVINTWHSADQAFQPVVDSARSELAQLSERRRKEQKEENGSRVARRTKK